MTELLYVKKCETCGGCPANGRLGKVASVNLGPVRIVVPPEERKFRCDECNRTLVDRYRLMVRGTKSANSVTYEAWG